MLVFLVWCFLGIPGKAAPAKWNWKPSVVQGVEFTLLQHTFRVLDDPGLRYELVHKPFVHDWFASYGGYDLKRWGDGDDFVVNDVGHPLQGAVYSRLYLQNNPRSYVLLGRTRDYWVTWAQSVLWAAVWEVQWKVGPLSEASMGNAGGWTYVPNCGTSLSCLNNPAYPKPPTNNTGLSDWIMSPVFGGLWVLAEDTLEHYVVVPVARNHRILGGRILRGCLEPSRDLASLFAGKLPWQTVPSYYALAHPKPAEPSSTQENFVRHWDLGAQYTALELPSAEMSCRTGCREFFSGPGFTMSRDLARHVAFDGTVNLFPGQHGDESRVQGEFGVKVGENFRYCGIYAKLRPGFIYYQEAYPGGGAMTPTNLTRFAWDLGGGVEVYTGGQGAVRLDVGATVVRYLADAPDQRISPLGSLLSTQYYVNQGNKQISLAYVRRF